MTPEIMNIIVALSLALIINYAYLRFIINRHFYITARENEGKDVYAYAFFSTYSDKVMSLRRKIDIFANASIISIIEVVALSWVM